jgi:hypothetical protein
MLLNQAFRHALRHALRIAAFAIPALFVAGCDRAHDATPAAGVASDDASTAASRTTIALPRACALVTDAEAQAVIGQAVAAMADEPENCMWASAGNPGQFTMFMVQIVQGQTPAETRTLFESLTGVTSDLNAMVNERIGAQTQASGESIANFGDAAWRSSSNADMVGARQLIVRKGLTILVLNVTGMRKDSAGSGFDARMEIAGRAALARMGGGS